MRFPTKPRYRQRRPRKRQDNTFWALLIIVAVGGFAFGMGLPEKDKASAIQSFFSGEVETHPYRYFANCRQAHAAGRYNIPARDPSYRPSLDRDGDGYACEPYRR